MKQPIQLLILLSVLLLAACSSVIAAPAVEPTAMVPVPTTARPTEVLSARPTQPSTVPVTQPAVRPLSELVDEQGMVVVIIQPLNVGSGEEWLKFEVSMNTHSVDLSMDLAALASLATNNGLTVQAILWEAPRGGHHVKGTLVFPASVDGKSLFDGATELILIIKEVDVPVRIFTWSLNQ
jgi:hypothetical protein